MRLKFEIYSQEKKVQVPHRMFGHLLLELDSRIPFKATFSKWQRLIVHLILIHKHGHFM